MRFDGITMTDYFIRFLPRMLLCTLLAAAFSGCVKHPDRDTGTASASAQTATPAWSLLPLPAKAEPAAGQLLIRSGDTLVVPAGHAELLGIATRFAELVSRTRGIQLAVSTAATATDQAAIVLALDPTVNGAEGYRIDIDDRRMRISASQPAGLYYGTVSAWQLLTGDTAHADSARVQAGTIVDRPRFAWRGYMLDSARHFQSVDEIKQMIDWMALHKLNTLHWHITDDQGWRLEIKAYPKLTSIGACREAVGPAAALTGGTDKPYCGFYTQDQAREVVAYAAERYITVVPEIEVPGHAQAPIAAYPEFGVTGERPRVSTDWGVNVWLYNAEPKTIGFLQQVLDEVMVIFPSPYIHIGGDEAVKNQWQASPRIQARIKQLGLADENALQSRMITQMEKYLDSHGRRLIGWDEILEGGLPPQATVMSWRGVKGAIEAANQGHDVVMTPGPTLYLDYLQSAAHDEPPGRPTIVTLQDVYAFDLVPDEINAEQAKHVIGAQLNLFAEYMPTFARAQHATFPRMAALAETTWSPAASHDWDSFRSRLPTQLARYRALGIAYADSAVAPQFAFAAGTDGAVQATLSTQASLGSMHYTLDGSTPTASSPRYAEPLQLTPPLTLSAITFNTDGSALSAPRQHAITTSLLRTHHSDQLLGCGGGLELRLEDDRPLDGPRPVYKVDIMNTCAVWTAAPTEDATRIAVTVGNLPWNYALANKTTAVMTRPKAHAHGEVDVYLGGCDGKRIASLSLDPASESMEQTTLTASFPALQGNQDLCFATTGDPTQGVLWAIDTVTLH